MKLTTIIKNFFHKDLLSNFFKANVVETESQSNFSQFIKNKDFQSIIRNLCDLQFSLYWDINKPKLLLIIFEDQYFLEPTHKF